ncbi:DUF2785 domain-containing protein [Nocardioides sp.]|uniref:DUF2785 domain-containing protein n=1 Tax=Nocardioides sp. TaxID=35761 RepID=UPI003D0D3254
MASTASPFWQQVVRDGLRVPTDRPLGDMTAELTAMLGSTEPELRDGIAYPTLATWIGRGVYDDLLSGLGDGMVAGLSVGLGEQGTDTVFRRAFSVLVLGCCISRNNEVDRLSADKVLEWGDRLTAWYVREKDLRGYVRTSGWAHAVAHGADAIAALAASPHFGKHELTVLLDVIADRILLPVAHVFTNGEPDRLAAATMAILRRDLVPLSVLEPWVARLAGVAARPPHHDIDPFLTTGNPESFLRALYLALTLLQQRQPACRADLLLTLVDALRMSNPFYFTDVATGQH